MKYKIISVAALCLMLLNSLQLKAQIEVISDKGRISIDSAIKTLETITTIHQKQRIVDEPYDRFYKRADSLNTNNSILKISPSLKQIIEELNTKEPYLFLLKAQSLYESIPSVADDIAVLMYIGLMRFDYYTNINPSYKNRTNKGWMKYEDFIQQNYKSRIELYLANNIEKYQQVLKYTIDYCNENDYTYSNSQKDKLIHKKAMQQYENLHFDLINNKEALSKKWAADKANRLRENNLNLTDKNNSNEERLGFLLENLRLEKEKNDLWAKIQVERKNLNSDVLKQYVRDFNTIKKKIDDISVARSTNNKQEIGTKTTDVQTKLDNSKSIYTSTKSNTKLDTINNQLDIYNYYDKQDENSTVNAFIAKVNTNILAYVNTMKWDEEKKLSVLKLMQYRSASEPINEPIAKTSYLANAELNTKPVEDFTGVNIYIKKAKRQQAMLFYILGEVEGTLVWEDLHNMIHDLKKKTFENFN